MSPTRMPSSGEDNDLDAVGRRLSSERPTLDDAGIERLVLQSRRLATSRSRGLRSTRIAILASLVLGFCFSGAGAGLAISGIGNDATSAQEQYAAPSTGSGTLGDSDSGTPAPADTTPAGDETAPDSDSAPGEDAAAAPTPAPAEPVQAERQLGAEASSVDELPFTGWAATPIVLLGLLLLGTGFVLRRRTRPL